MFKGFMIRLILALAILSSTIAFPAAAQDNGCDMPLSLSPNMRINTRPGINIRNLPTISGGIAEYLESSITFRIQEGPVCADGINWWRVRGPVNFNPGWVAEREALGGRYLIFRADPDPAELCPEPLNFVSGSRFPLLNDVRIRQQPSLDGLVLHVAEQGVTATIINGPDCFEEINWWLVQVPYRGLIIQGWMAEGRFGDTFIRDPDLPPPDQICGPARRLPIGGRAAISVTDFKPKNLRSIPGLNSPILYGLIDGIPVDVLAGPVCADNLNWWQVQIVSRPEVIGWLSEGGPGNYAIRRFTQDRLPGN